MNRDERHNYSVAKNINVGDQIYVPSTLVEGKENHPYALLESRVIAKRNRTVDIDGIDANAVSVPTSKVHKEVGFLVISIGDFDTELTLINPLSKSILHFFRLMVSDDQLVYCQIRTLDELKEVWIKYSPSHANVIFIGHGRRDAIKFFPSWVNSLKFLETLNQANTSVTSTITRKNFVFLCCNTGYKDFSKSFSESELCSVVISPFHSVHGAIASQFCQTLFTHHLIDGRSLKVAFKLAKKSVPSSVSFRFWQNGSIN